MSDANRGGSSPRDGEVNFASYSEAQLHDIRDQIDAARFPQNYNNLLAELERRHSNLTSGHRFSVRHTNVDGFVGWLQAKLAAQSQYGDGTIEVQFDQTLLQGWQRTWLGLAQVTVLHLATSRIRNVYHDGSRVEFEYKRKGWLPKRFTFLANDVVDATAIVALLPRARTKWFDAKSSEIQTFYRLLRLPGHTSWLTPLFVFLNISAYVALAIEYDVLGGFDAQALVQSGAIYPSMIASGEWWRLVTATFLQLNLLHIAVNMWVLWSVGRFTERLFGNWSFLGIYVVAGVVGGLASLAWNPGGVVVGASGAIFGILGGLIAFLIHGSTRIPVSVMRAQLLPTILFVLYSVISGLFQIGIDNASHVGGLLTGFVLGWSLAPLGQLPQRRSILLQSVVGSLLVGSLGASLFIWIVREESSQTPVESFLRRNQWYTDGETSNLRLWQSLANQANSGTISNADLATQFETKIIPFWQLADTRLGAEATHVSASEGPIARTLAEFAHSRRLWADTLVSALRSTDPTLTQKALTLVQQTDVIQARIDRLASRYSYDKATGSLSESAPVVKLKNLVWYSHSSCVAYPFNDTNPVAATDSDTDAPKQAAALGCDAQRLFLTRQFEALELRLNYAASHLGDLPDGTSSFDAMVGGLDDLLSYGGMTIQQQLSRTAAWRRMMPGSIEADLTEALILGDWAYTARGYGSANTISQQNYNLFLHRAEMSNAAIMALGHSGPSNPLWFQLALRIGLERSAGVSALKRLFDQGRLRFPSDWAMYRAMMRALMPRWGGSYEAEARFIVEQGQKESSDTLGWQTVARLLWMYSIMEQDEVNVFDATHIPWDDAHVALVLLARRFSHSDYVGNMLGKLACVAGDKNEYAVFHSHLPQHYSASAWSQKVTLQSCNAKFSL